MPENNLDPEVVELIEKVKAKKWRIKPNQPTEYSKRITIKKIRSPYHQLNGKKII
jgi:hypothetical protein